MAGSGLVLAWIDPVTSSTVPKASDMGVAVRLAPAVGDDAAAIHPGMHAITDAISVARRNDVVLGGMAGQGGARDEERGREAAKAMSREGHGW